MKDSLIRTYDKIEFLKTKLPRKIFAKGELKKKKQVQKIKSLTPQEKSRITALWGKIKINTDYLSLYNRYNTTFDPRYIPDNLFFADVDMYFNSAKDAKAIDDKNLYDFYFHDVRHPKTIARKTSNSYLDASYQIISFEEMMAKCLTQKEVIVKKAMNSNSGRDVLFWSTEDGTEVLKKILLSSYDYVVQEVIKQHPIVGSLHESSINTLRILTLYYKDKLHILSSVIRMGVNGSRVDNTPYSGLFCGINTDGTLKKYAYNMGGFRFEQHPNGTIFSDIKIPNFDKCTAFVTRLAPRFIRFSKLTSWDVAINQEGLPTLIEVNLNYGQLDYHQYTNGPVFGDLTEELIKEVWGK